MGRETTLGEASGLQADGTGSLYGLGSFCRLIDSAGLIILNGDAYTCARSRIGLAFSAPKKFGPSHTWMHQYDRKETQPTKEVLLYWDHSDSFCIEMSGLALGLFVFKVLQKSRKVTAVERAVSEHLL
jgi:hypothetical protein